MKTPVLMVHGMSCTGEVWSLFRNFFEERGATVYTPTLRADLRCALKARPSRELSKLRLLDYVDDLEQETRRIEDQTGLTPAVIGHSMGGLLCQALAARGRVAAAVFISPAAPGGIRTFQSNLFWTGYTFAHQRGWTPRVIRPARRVVDRMVTNVLPVSERAAALAGMVCESGTVFAEFAHFPVDETLVRVPTLTIAATRDRLIPAPLVRLTAKKYAAVGGEFREYKNHGHWLYSEPGWQTPAHDIYQWLERVTEQPALDRTARVTATAEAQPGQ